MKQLNLLTVTLVAIILASCNKNDGVRLTGKIENAAGEKIFLEQINLSQTTIVDSVKIEADGTFELAAPRATEPTFFRAFLDDTRSITFIADSTETIEVQINSEAKNWLESIEFINSEESQQIQDMNARVAALQLDLQQYELKYNDMSDAERTAFNDKFVGKIAQHKSYIQQYVFENPRSFVSYYALFQAISGVQIFDVTNNDDRTLFATIATSLNLVYPESERVKQLCNLVLSAQFAQRRRQQVNELINSADEVKSPDLSMPSLSGDTLKLSSLRGKIIILQFWTSADEKSRSYNRQLAKLYTKYHDKGLEIYQVSFDTSRVLWEQASQNDNLQWSNVCDLRGASSIAARLYNVTQVPSNYIIDRDGTLIGKNLFATRLDNKISELLD